MEDATYVSVWDGGIEIRTRCLFNRAMSAVFDVESVDANGLDILEDEYVELADGTEIRNFITEDDLEHF
jgi:hypothetical protein